MGRYFIALLPPQDIQAQVNQIKQHFADNYASCGAQKSPPHITLQPPFEWRDEDLPLLAASLQEFSQERQSFAITLKNYNAFPPRVIYIDVVRSPLGCSPEALPQLLQLQADLLTHLETTLGISDKVAKNRPFVPHMTVAFRDLTKINFHRAWQEFQKQEIYLEFLANSLTLLLHDGDRWNVKTEFSFCGSS
ncbi:2'-5' RNA ligase family protein [Calothrix sp. 336/3]|uniref:2'-5' RNA ligase family protein n=1 Tax=Calothrix sp. 336/3 TaxID=1337936 RepID=UPI0004E2CE1B|nr:2'-5' RNA ligase family protein [Calothrix sp. 336/3]AKG20793.1 2'-5' RNA ligase [Calothrix sp. 336/3]